MTPFSIRHFLIGIWVDVNLTPLGEKDEKVITSPILEKDATCKSEEYTSVNNTKEGENHAR